MSFSNTFETRVLDWVFTTGGATRPTVWYLGLFTSDPTGAGTGNEVSGNGYTRKSASFTVVGDLATNSASIEFDAATASWGTVSHVAVFDAATTGNMIAYSALTTAKAVSSGDILRVPAGDLDITLD
mgnify:CR=1 FL=1|tara:strand:- start:2254 stop:2634 length:381 start_codon:yes stop_codon:yes gene_type:complete